MEILQDDIKVVYYCHSEEENLIGRILFDDSNCETHLEAKPLYIETKQFYFFREEYFITKVEVHEEWDYYETTFFLENSKGEKTYYIEEVYY